MKNWLVDSVGGVIILDYYNNYSELQWILYWKETDRWTNHIEVWTSGIQTSLS